MTNGGGPQIGVLMSISQKDYDGSPSSGGAERVKAIKDGLSGQVSNPNTILYPEQYARIMPGDDADYPGAADKVVAQNPQAVFSSCWPTLIALCTQMDTHKKYSPIVYAGLFHWMHPGGSPNGTPQDYTFGYSNVTGFVSHEFVGLCDQWWPYLNLVAPWLTRYSVLYESGTIASGGQGQFRVITGSDNPRAWDVDLSKIAKPTPAKIDAAIKTIADGTTGLIVTTGALTAALAHAVVDAANKYQVPAIYPNNLYVERGGLMSYGTDLLSLYQNAGSLLGQIIQNPSMNLPAPVINQNFYLAFNTTTATAQNVTIPSNLKNTAKWIYV